MMWTLSYVDEMVREVLECCYMERRRSVFTPSQKKGFDWDRTVGMTVRAWMYIQDHPAWLNEVPFGETVEEFAVLLGLAVEKTTNTGPRDVDFERYGSIGAAHVVRQMAERELVTEFVKWSLKSHCSPRLDKKAIALDNWLRENFGEIEASVCVGKDLLIVMVHSGWKHRAAIPQLWEGTMVNIQKVGKVRPL